MKQNGIRRPLKSSFKNKPKEVLSSAQNSVSLVNSAVQSLKHVLEDTANTHTPSSNEDSISGVTSTSTSISTVNNIKSSDSGAGGSRAEVESEAVAIVHRIVSDIQEVRENVSAEAISMDNGRPANMGKKSKPIRGILKKSRTLNEENMLGLPKEKETQAASGEEASHSSPDSKGVNGSRYNLSPVTQKPLSNGTTDVTNIPRNKEDFVLSSRYVQKQASLESSTASSPSSVETSSGAHGKFSRAASESSAHSNGSDASSPGSAVPRAAASTPNASSTDGSAVPRAENKASTPNASSPNGSAVPRAAASTPYASSPDDTSSTPTAEKSPPLVSASASSKDADIPGGDLSKSSTLETPRSSVSRLPSTEAASGSDTNSASLSRGNSSDKPAGGLSRRSSGTSTDTVRRWKKTGMAVKTSLKFQEAGRLAKIRKAMAKFKKDSIRYINALAKDHVPEDEDPFILQHFNDRKGKYKPPAGTSKPGTEEQGAFVVDPAGDLYFFTQALVTVAMLYNLVSSVLRMTFGEFEEENQFVIFTLDSICDVLYLLDFVVKFRTGYLYDGILVTDIQKIKENYMASQTFSLDLVAVLPLCISYGVAMEIYQHSAYFFTNRPDVEASMIKNILIGEATLRLFKLAKFYSMRRFFESFGSRTNSPGVMRAFCLIMYLLLSIHWVACFYYCISEYEGFGINSWVFPGYEEGDPNNCLHRKYIHCFYWAFLTLTTIGGPDQPDTTLEYILTCITFLLGIFIFAAVVGNVGDAITSMNESKTTYHKRADAIKLYMHHHGVPDILQRKVKKWLEYSWTRTQGADEQSLMDALPERLRARIAIQIHVKTLKKVKIFENCEHGLLCELVLKLKPQIFSPGDYICRIGEIGKEMFIISHGKVECIITLASGERKTVAVLVAGQSFGEIALLGVEGCSRRTADVRAIGYSELLSLSKKALTQALEDYPEARKQLEQEGRNRLGKGSSSQSNSAKEVEEHCDQPADPAQINHLISQIKSFDSLMYKEKLTALTAEKEALELQLETKTKELEDAKRLIQEYITKRTRLK